MMNYLPTAWYHLLFYPKTLLITALLGYSLPSIAAVYKTTAPEGGVVYTDNIDTAYHYSQDSQQISVVDKLSRQLPVQPILAATLDGARAAPSFAPAPTLEVEPLSADTPSAVANTLTAQRLQPTQKGTYTLQIQTPKNEMAYRHAAQNITVTVALNHPLKNADRLVYRLDQKTLATTKNTTYTIATDKLDPKKYTLTVSVENLVGETIATDTKIIYVISNNLIFQQKRKAFEAAQQEYAKLPWYKKLKVNVNL